MIIGIDFDGTCVTHEFPEVGKDIGAVPVLKELVKAGHKLVLFTMRSNRRRRKRVPESPDVSDVHGKFLKDAVSWFKENDIPLFGVNTNPEQKSWTSSPKAYCHLYIDDASLGIPLKRDIAVCDRPFVDWVEVRALLRTRFILK